MLLLDWIVNLRAPPKRVAAAVSLAGPAVEVIGRGVALSFRRGTAPLVTNRP